LKEKRKVEEKRREDGDGDGEVRKEFAVRHLTRARLFEDASEQI
jgi:hypothetical protein